MPIARMRGRWGDDPRHPQPDRKISQVWNGTRFDPGRWMKMLPQPWSPAMEATMFTG